MRLDELSLTGFGRLTNATFAFQPGLNLIVGPNEAGKSTLLQAMFTLLYGFFDSGSVTGPRRELLDAYRPWNTTVDYHGALTFSLHDGQRYRVERTFGSHMTTSLSMLPQQKDVSTQYKSDSFGRLYFAEDLLGMSRTVFEHTCCLRQSELARLDKSASAITEAIMRLTTSGAADASATDSVEKLKLVLRDEIGTARAWTKPLASAQKELNHWVQARESEAQRQAQLWSLLREINQYEARLAHLKLQKDRQTYLSLSAAQAERRESLTRIDQARRDIESRRRAVAELASYANVAVHLRDELLSQSGEWKRQQARIAQTATRDANLQVQLADLRLRIEKTNQQLGGSVYKLDLRPSTRDRIQVLRTQWLHALDEQHKATQMVAASDEQVSKLTRQPDAERIVSQKTLTIGTVGLVRLQTAFEQTARDLDSTQQRFDRVSNEWSQVGMSEDEFQAYAARANALRSGDAPIPPPRRGCNPFRSSPPSTAEDPTELTIFRDIAPIHTKLEEASNQLNDARKHYREAELRVRSSLGLTAADPITDELFRSKADELAKIGKTETQLQLLSGSGAEARQRASQLPKVSATAAAELRNALLEQGIRSDDPNLGVEEYLHAYEQQAQQASIAAEIEKLQQQQATVLAQLGQTNQLHIELATAEQRIRALLVEAGLGSVPAQSIEQRIDAYQQLCEQHERWLTAKRELETAEQQLRLLQKIDQEDGTIHQIEVTDRQLRQLQQIHPEWIGLTLEQSKADYDQLLQASVEQLQEAQNEASRLRHQMESLENHSAPLADLDEQSMMAANHFAQLSHASICVSKAIEMLQDATTAYQKTFAPRLETRIAQGLSKVTKSRYQRVQLSPADLALDVWSPEANAWVSTELLSTGTRDLIYLVMRIAISDLLGSGKEPLPLLLDDPFVHLDASREQQALAYLGEIAQGYQVLYFSKDSSLPDRLQDGFDRRAVTYLSVA